MKNIFVVSNAKIKGTKSNAYERTKKREYE
jgi:hypothetical protein